MPNDKYTKDTLEEIRRFWNIQPGRTSTVRNKVEDINYLLSLHKQQQEEIERLKLSNDDLSVLSENILLELIQSREENARLTSEQEYAKRQAIKWNDEAVRLKGLYERERDIAEQAQSAAKNWHDAAVGWEEKHKLIEAERDDYRNVLEWIRDAGTDYQSIDRARTILQKYEKGDSQHERD
jgi:hypothetical protein